jgi:ADP-heptose:LPS heptosyltransferase
LKVGISWRGGADEHVRRMRSTILDQWSELLRTPRIQFINLQYGATAEELAHVERETGIRIHHWNDADPLCDLDDFAAQIAALDLVISVDNSTVHMAGALGVETWVLLPFAADWRWMLDRSDTPWYCRVRLFRQPRAGCWPPTFSDVAAELARRMTRADTRVPTASCGSNR